MPSNYARVLTIGFVLVTAGCAGDSEPTPAPTACMTEVEFADALGQATDGDFAGITPGPVVCEDGYQLSSVGFSNGDGIWIAVWPDGDTFRYEMYNAFGYDGCRATDVLPPTLVEEMCPGGPPVPITG